MILATILATHQLVHLLGVLQELDPWNSDSEVNLDLIDCGNNFTKVVC